jgi:glycosyltransferase involved in cell wall biosynthesis
LPSSIHNPLVSVIIPARNEESCIGTCLASLLAQTGIDFEIIVVNDSSIDGTEKIARSFARVDVIPAGPLSHGWTGKNNAMSAGARAAKGKWLLFSDADTFHKPGSLARAVAEAEEHGAALLSYSPEQEVRTIWEKAVMPVIFAELSVTYPPDKVNDPRSPIAAANGQYLLISREAYDAVGGHTTIGGDLLEDVAMARLVKSSGRKIFFRYGGDAVRTRMYRSLAQMKEGWTKNLALLFPTARVLAYFRLGEFALIAGNLLASVCAAVYGLRNIVFTTLLLALVVTVVVCRRLLRAHAPALATATAILGLPVFSYLLIHSAKLRDKGVTWKGRKYCSKEDILALPHSQS